MWRVQAFSSGMLPRGTRSAMAQIPTTTSKSRLRAVNSRELRFLSGSTHTAFKEQEEKQVQDDLLHQVQSSAMNMLATSLPQYFFANSNGELMMNLMQSNTQRQL